MAASTEARGLAMGSRMLPPGGGFFASRVVVGAAAWSIAARWIMTAFSFRNRVVAARTAGPAAAQAPHRQAQAAPGAVGRHGFKRVWRAGRGEAARGDVAASGQLVGPNGAGDHPGGRTVAGVAGE